MQLDTRMLLVEERNKMKKRETGSKDRKKVGTKEQKRAEKRLLCNRSRRGKVKKHEAVQNEITLATTQYI